MVPEEVVRPATRFTLRVGVGAAEEEGLHVHLLYREFARGDPVVHPLVGGIEAAHVVDHRDDPGLLLDAYEGLGVDQAVGHRDLDQHVLAGAHGGGRLGCVDRCGCRKDRGLDSRHGEGFLEVEGPVGDAALRRHGACRVGHAAAQGRDLDAVDTRQGVQVPVAEGAFAGHADLHSSIYRSPAASSFSRMP